MRAVPEAVGDAEASAGEKPRAIVVMGVAGCGKTVVATALAESLGWRMIEGDQLHPPANVEKMSAGLPLTDDDRWGWLDAIGKRIAAAAREGESAVAACSALKRAYRDRLRRHHNGILFVHLAVDKATAAERVGSRKGHFMPATLVDSQFAALEPPRPDETAVTIDATRPVADIVTETAEILRDD